jgi:hypothetical protein
MAQPTMSIAPASLVAVNKTSLQVVQAAPRTAHNSGSRDTKWKVVGLTVHLQAATIRNWLMHPGLCFDVLLQRCECWWLFTHAQWQ